VSQKNDTDIAHYNFNGQQPISLIFRTVLLQKLWVTGWVIHHSGSSRWCSTRTADNIDLVDELVLHKNCQAKNNICTLYLILRPYCLQKNYQNWLISVKDIESQSRHSRYHDWKDPF